MLLGGADCHKGTRSRMLVNNSTVARGQEAARKAEKVVPRYAILPPEPLHRQDKETVKDDPETPGEPRRTSQSPQDIRATEYLSLIHI